MKLSASEFTGNGARWVLSRLGLFNHVRRLRLVLLGKKRGLAFTFRNGRINIKKGNFEIWLNHAHIDYAYEMLNAFDVYCTSVEPTQHGENLVIDFSSPRVHRMKGSGLELEFPSLVEAESSIHAYIQALALKPGDVVLDLGAYAGATTCLFAQAVGPGGLVVALEPDPATFPYLRANISRHQLSNVRLLPNGVWSETTTIEFQSEGCPGSSAAALVGRYSNVTPVQVITLERLAEVMNLERVDAIKMDIEGAELPVLGSARGFLQRFRPSLVVEPHYVQGGLNTQEICQLFHSYGYKPRLVSQGIEGWPLVAASAV